MKERVGCDTTILKNKSLLYYQFDCDSIWLTLENISGNKKVIDNMDPELYRLGYYLTKEFQRSLLFRHSCLGSAPCEYDLIDKETGKLIKEFGKLIYNADDSLSNFIVYFSDDSFSFITLHYIDTDKKYKIKILTEQFNGIEIHAEQQFERPKIENNLVTLLYRYKLKYEEKDWSVDRIIIDLSKYPN